jgi:hypothetical protein
MMPARLITCDFVVENLSTYRRSALDRRTDGGFEHTIQAGIVNL